jgi:hypothetical protein
MKFKTILLGTAAVALMAGPAVAATDASKHHHHHHVDHAAGASSVEARIDQLERELQELKAAQAAPAATAPSDAVSQAQFEALQNQVYEQQAATQTLTKSSWWANTKITGRFFWDITSVDATGHVKTAAATSFHTKSPQNGFNYDLKRAYLIIDHKFNDTYSANLTTDATYDSTTGASQVFIKKAFLQAAYAKEFTVRVGASDLPWVPFVESIYGYRYVENVLIDRTKFGTSTDWGAHFLGTFDLGGPTLGYQFSAINGFGYKADPIGNGTNRSMGVDFEGRVNLNWDGFVAAVGGYDGKRGKDVQNTQLHCGNGQYDTTCYTAKRVDALIGYTDDQFRVGAEYFSEHDYNSVASTSLHPHDTANGYSAFASWKFDPMWSVFGRYDWVKPTDVRIFSGASAAKNQYYNLGVSYSPIPALDFALVYKHDGMSNGTFSDSEFNTFTCVAYGHPNVTHGTCNEGTYNEIGLFGQVNF